jgi:hypothetical protein
MASFTNFRGKVTIGGEVSGDIVFMGGELTLQPNARVGSNLNLANDNYRLSPHASVIGKINTGMALPDLPEQRPNNLWQRVLRTLFGGAVFGLFAALLSRYLPTPVQRVSAAAVHHSLISGAMGLLVGVGWHFTTDHHCLHNHTDPNYLLRPLFIGGGGSVRLDRTRYSPGELGEQGLETKLFNLCLRLLWNHGIYCHSRRTDSLANSWRLARHRTGAGKPGGGFSHALGPTALCPAKP